MYLTKKSIRLLVVGAPLWILHPLYPMGWLPATAYIGILTYYLIRDGLKMVKPADLRVEREMPARFSFDSQQHYILKIANHGKEPVKLEVCDTLPRALELKSKIPTQTLQGGERVRLQNQVLPIQRGLHRFGHVYLRMESSAGLIQRQIVLPSANEVRIYPRFVGVEQFELLARLDERSEAVRMPRMKRGEGNEFESLRAYIPGEDLRRVDWKVSAKRGTLISKNLQVERGQQLAVLVDAGRLMNEKIGKYTRFEHALNAVTMLSYVAQRRGDAMAVTSFSNKIESFLPPMKGTALFAAVLESLYQVEPSMVESDYWNVMARLTARLKKRSLLIMITEVLDQAGSSGMVRNLIRAARKHLVLCVVFVEARIYEEAASIPNNDEQVWIKAAAAHVSLERRLALEQMRTQGILVLETTPDQLSLSLIRKYLEIRGANLQ